VKENVNVRETVVAMLVNDAAVLGIAHPAPRCIFFLFLDMVLNSFQELKDRYIFL
jgi:hypothetical protein